MVKMLRTSNDARNINHATIAQKYKFRFKEWLRPLYSVQAFEKRPRHWGANIICLANLESHVITYDLTRQGVIYLQEGN